MCAVLPRLSLKQAAAEQRRRLLVARLWLVEQGGFWEALAVGLLAALRAQSLALRQCRPALSSHFPVVGLARKVEVPGRLVGVAR